MKQSLVRQYSRAKAGRTYKKFGRNTRNDSGAYEQKECTPDAELGLLFLIVMLFLGVLAAMSITCRIADFDIRSRRT